MSKLSVMKGDKFTYKRLHKWLEEDGRVVVQTKRDEIRCVVEIHPMYLVLVSPTPDYWKVTYTSASGKPLYNLSCFDASWIDFAKVTGKYRIDTGVCVNESFDLTRRTVLAKTKSYDLSGDTGQFIAGDKKKDPPYYEGTLRAVFWLYDVTDHPGTYEERRHSMAGYAKEFFWFLACPETFIVEPDEGIPTEAAISEAADFVNSLFEEATGRGFEGLMIKRFYHNWEPKRCPDSWMKMKPEEEVDVRISGYTPGEGRFEGLIGSLTGVAEDGSEVSFSGFSDDERIRITAEIASILSEQRVAEVRYMQRDSLGGYRHPRFYRWHADK